MTVHRVDHKIQKAQNEDNMFVNRTLILQHSRSAMDILRKHTTFFLSLTPLTSIFIFISSLIPRVLTIVLKLLNNQHLELHTQL
jgi:hypothetical protein